MKRKKTPKAKQSAKQPAAKRTPATAPQEPNAPVTLEQARALAKAQAPRRTVAKSSGPRRGLAPRAIAPAATVATIGIERKKLKIQQRRENEDRIREYKETMAILKRRGVKAPAPRRAAAGPRRRAPKAAAAAPVKKPLQVFAEGDSWFDYPVLFFGGGVIPRLEDLLGVPILNLAKAGDEVRFMLGVEERKILAKQLQKGCPAGGPWDALLFSGGGNDVVDNPMALWIRDFDPAVPPAKLIHAGRYATILALVRAGYEDLIKLRDDLSPQTHLLFHAYDFAIPDGRGICHLGPWLKPTFDLRGFPQGSPARFAVVKTMLQQFAEMMADLAKHHARVTFINGQGTLKPETKSWHNELHPSRDGFRAFASIFHAKLKLLFPGRVF